MAKPKILMQLDVDRHASSFDAVVAIDAGVDHLLQYSGVSANDVQAIVHGAIFTRGMPDLQRSAIFVGGTDVVSAESVLQQVTRTFLGPLRVSVMLDANGANTTAAAAVLKAAGHLVLSESTVLVLAATGSVGQRVVQLLAGSGATVRVGSRSHSRAQHVCEQVALRMPAAALEACECDSEESVGKALAGTHGVIAAGAAGVQLMSSDALRSAAGLGLAIDLNAVPPFGIEGVDVQDRSAERGGVVCYGAVGIGGTKMKIHKAAIRSLFESNDRTLDADEIYRIGQQL